MVLQAVYGWHPDPFGLHEHRYFSGGRPTKLVRDGVDESYDEPPMRPLVPPSVVPPSVVPPSVVPPSVGAAPALEPVVGDVAAAWTGRARSGVAEHPVGSLRQPRRRPARRRLALCGLALALLAAIVVGVSSSGQPTNARPATGEPSSASTPGASPNGGTNTQAGAALSGSSGTEATASRQDSSPSGSPLGASAIATAPIGAGSSHNTPGTTSAGAAATSTTGTPTTATATTATRGTSGTTPGASSASSAATGTTRTSAATSASTVTSTTATTTTSTSTTPLPVAHGTSTWWAPSASTTVAWQWELAHPLSLSSSSDLALGDSTAGGAPAPAPSIYDIDGFDNGAATVAGLHALGAHVICYIDVGTYEDWRPDASAFPAALLGASNGWPGEQWLDTSPAGADYATLQAIMTARFEMCKDEGYDAVEPDNLDGAENTTGFSISIAQGDQYAEWVANEVHALGMGVAQKNFEDQSSVLEPYFDFVIEEQCYQYDDCGDLAPYVAAHKAVLDVEYSDQGANPATFCPVVRADGLSGVEFDTALDGAVRVPCA